jgi:hypothetical protein
MTALFWASVLIGLPVAAVWLAVIVAHCREAAADLRKDSIWQGTTRDE